MNDLILPVVLMRMYLVSLNGRYSGSDENVAGENGASFDSSANLGILDAVSGSERVHASPEMDVSWRE